MSIVSFYARNMLRQSARPSLRPSSTGAGAFRPPIPGRARSEPPELSEDMKRRIVVERVARELFEHLLFSDSTSPVLDEIRQALRREFGEELFFQYLSGDTKVVVLRKTLQGKREISPARRTAVLERAWEITLDKVGETML